MWARPEFHCRATSRGVTLLELLVVLAIIASVSAAFPLALNRFVPARRVDAAARELLADLRLAQARSTATNAMVTLLPSAHGYVLREGKAEASLWQSRAWKESTALELRSNDGARPLAELRLYPDGSSSGGRLLIRDGARERGITVSELTGRVRLESTPFKPGGA